MYSTCNQHASSCVLFSFSTLSTPHPQNPLSHPPHPHPHTHTPTGHRLHPTELHRLLNQLDPANTGRVARAQLAASMMDFAALHQGRHRDLWLSSVRRVFAELDCNGDGIIDADEIVACVGEMLPAQEVCGCGWGGCGECTSMCVCTMLVYFLYAHA